MENKTKKILSSLSSKEFELILYPTEQCNFRCVYCYEDFELGKMNGRVIGGVKNLLKLRSEEVEVMRLSWFGGEPLLALDVIEDVSQYAKELSEKKGFTLLGSMTTNGYSLSLPVAKNLYDYGVRHYQISLDGDKEHHDETRVSRLGKGTFDRIYENLSQILASDLDVEIMLRIHVTNKNVDSVRSLLGKIKPTFLSDRRFSVYIKPVENLGGAGSFFEGRVQKDEKGDILKELNSLVASSTIPESKEDGLYICYASKPNSFAVRSDGRIQKCTVMLNDERNTLGQINVSGLMDLDHEKLKLWMRGFSTLDGALLKCPAVNLPQLVEEKILEFVEA